MEKVRNVLRLKPRLRIVGGADYEPSRSLSQRDKTAWEGRLDDQFAAFRTQCQAEARIWLAAVNEGPSGQ